MAAIRSRRALTRFGFQRPHKFTTMADQTIEQLKAELERLSTIAEFLLCYYEATNAVFTSLQLKSEDLKELIAKIEKIKSER